MTRTDTSLGGEGRFFPETTAGLMQRFRHADRAALEALCRRYWKPVYAYLRAAYGKDNEEAKDLTQAFFVRLLEGPALAEFDPARGGFRTYLKVLLRSFVGHHQEAAAALKRGGGGTVISLDAGPVPYEEIVPDPRAADPEEVFERIWRMEMAERVLESVRERCRSRGLELRFRIYEAYALVPAEERPTYIQLASRFGVRPDDVRTHLAAARAELREALRGDLAATTPDDRTLQAEWNELFGTRTEG